MKRLSVVLVGMVILGVVLSACGGASGSDPTSAVKDVFQAMQDKKFDTIGNYVCAAQRDQIVASLNPASSLASGLGSGLDPAKVLDAMTITLENMEYTKVSESGTNAVVHVKGTMSLKFDKDKLSALMKSAGTDDASVQAALGMMDSMLGSGFPMDNDLNVVNEGGKWLVCQ